MNNEMIMIQAVYLACFQSFVIIFFSCSTGWWAILQLPCSQARCKLKMEPLKKVVMKPWEQAYVSGLYLMQQMAKDDC